MNTSPRPSPHPDSRRDAERGKLSGRLGEVARRLVRGGLDARSFRGIRSIYPVAADVRRLDLEFLKQSSSLTSAATIQGFIA
jgi:hypothetical protein